jgi:hypothetical protein
MKLEIFISQNLFADFYEFYFYSSNKNQISRMTEFNYFNVNCNQSNFSSGPLTVNNVTLN